jgi:phosphatidylserine/phosphatidylglycerophosphate/cardiolipin synthase-like enzyme
MSAALLALPGHVRARLIAAIETGLLAPPWPQVAIRSVLGGSTNVDEIANGLRALEVRGGSSGPVAAWLQGAGAGEALAQPPDLVWSGPEVAGLHARGTRDVYEEIIGGAERTLWVSTYAFYDGPKAFEPIARRMADRPDLGVTLLLNIQRARGDTSTSESVVRRFTDRFWAADWKGARRPSVYFDPRAVEPDRPDGVLHAKAVVADDESVFVTSANLTEAALDRNIELGLFLHDRALAESLSGHFRVLIERGLLHPLPAG